MSDLFTETVTPISDGLWDPFDEIPDAPRSETQEPEDEMFPELDGLHKVSSTKAFKKADHNLRTRELYEAKGYELVVRVDQNRVTYSGALFTLDFLGLFDWLAISPGKPDAGIQVCAREAIGSHVTAMCSSAITTFNKARKCDNLRIWLACGKEVHVVGWHQPDGKRFWKLDLRILTPEVLAGFDRRRRTK